MTTPVRGDWNPPTRCSRRDGRTELTSSNMATATRAPFTLLVCRAARAVWWCGLPLLLLASLFLWREIYAVDLLYDLANALWNASPPAAELVAHYPLWSVAMLILTGVTLWSHHRRSAAVRPESLALPTYVAGLEACARLSWFLTCRGGAAISPEQLRDELHLAAAASLVTMTAPLFLGAMLMATCPKGLAGRLSRRSLLSVIAATASIALIWLLYDLLLRGYIEPKAP